MTDTKLPWGKVYRTIQDVAREFAPSVPQRQTHSSMIEIFTTFGYELWCTLQKAYPEQFDGLVISDDEYNYEVYLAKQAKGVDKRK